MERSNNQVIGRYLLRAEILDKDTLKELLNKESKLSFIEQIARTGKGGSSLEITKKLAMASGLSFLSLKDLDIPPEILTLVPKEIAETHLVIPIKTRQDKLVLAMANPWDFNALDRIQYHLDLRVEPVLSEPAEIRDAIHFFYSQDNELEKIIEDFNATSLTKSDFDLNLSEGVLVKASPIVRLVHSIFAEAMVAKASDIHLESQQEKVCIRYRMDGVLQERMRLNKRLQYPIISRIKVMAELDISQKRIPQDGEISFEYAGQEIKLRVSVLPGIYGENVVLRILDPSSKFAELTELGFSPTHLLVVRRNIFRPQGVILSTGPTGSGKTSTQYAFLSAITNPQIKITTLENPVEYQLPWATQVEINEKAGLTFSKGLRSILRQDPDIILVGEIRDSETAAICMEAGMTGHMVMSTLHTNDAFGSIHRLLGLGVDYSTLAQTLLMIINQRLVRKICLKCREIFQPDFQTLSPLGLEDLVDCQRGIGCPSCNQSGYKGRTGIYEVFEINSSIRERLIKQDTLESIKNYAHKTAMTSLLQEAARLVREGVTSPTEISRVLRISDSTTETYNCPHCAKYIKIEFDGCPHCLVSLPFRCPQCQKAIKPVWETCEHCGGKLKKSEEIRGPRKITILITDDDEALIEIITEFLEEVSLTILTALDGPSAVQKAKTYLPDLILMDVFMPRMTGIEACTILRQDPKTADIPIIITTSDPSESIKMDAYSARADDFLIKPFSPEDLINKMKKLLRRKGIILSLDKPSS